MQEYTGACRSILEHAGVYWSMQEYTGDAAGCTLICARDAPVANVMMAASLTCDVGQKGHVYHTSDNHTFTACPHHIHHTHTHTPLTHHTHTLTHHSHTHHSHTLTHTTHTLTHPHTHTPLTHPHTHHSHPHSHTLTHTLTHTHSPSHPLTLTHTPHTPSHPHSCLAQVQALQSSHVLGQSLHSSVPHSLTAVQVEHLQRGTLLCQRTDTLIIHTETPTQVHTAKGVA